MESYDKLLEKALSKVPKKEEGGERFVIPKADIQPAGAKTIIINFAEIAAALRRDKQHLFKFLVKELATSGIIEGNRLTVIGRFPPPIVNKKIENYVNSYVMCEECNRPDTQIVKDDRMYFLKCEACGAKHYVKSINK